MLDERAVKAGVYGVLGEISEYTQGAHDSLKKDGTKLER
jgi:hypothetical protein